MPCSLVGDVETAPVEALGALIERHRRFPQRVNAGFMQIVSRRSQAARHERGVGETPGHGMALRGCGRGHRLGLLDARVDVHTRGGLLTIEWERRCARERAHDRPRGIRF